MFPQRWFISSPFWRALMRGKWPRDGHVGPSLLLEPVNIFVSAFCSSASSAEGSVYRNGFRLFWIVPRSSKLQSILASHAYVRSISMTRIEFIQVDCIFHSWKNQVWNTSKENWTVIFNAVLEICIRMCTTENWYVGKRDATGTGRVLVLQFSIKSQRHHRSSGRKHKNYSFWKL